MLSHLLELQQPFVAMKEEVGLLSVEEQEDEESLGP